MTLLLEGKIALVTGASRGIGAAIALALGQQGARVAGTATTREGADRIATHFEKNGISGIGVVLNITDQESINKALAEVESQLGIPLILVNNAGIARDNLMLRMKQEEWDEVINTNLNSLFRMTRVCIKGMLKARWGRIITISSVVGIAGNPGQANYAAAKAGIIGFSKSLAMEIASRSITVNVVAPGLVETDMSHGLTDQQRQQLMEKIPMGRLATPEEIAAGVVFLASPLASYITGETLNINGGMYMA